MRPTVEIDAGVCGFQTRATAITEDGQHAVFEIDSQCEKVRQLAETLCQLEPIDAYQEINPVGDSILLHTASGCRKGCCVGCAVLVGMFKAMQVACGLALPKDVTIKLTADRSENFM